MNRLLLIASIVYCLPGLAFTFGADEILARSGAPPSPAAVWLGQLVGAALLGLALLNWLQRYAVVGGVLGRPLLLTNLAFLTVSFFASVHAWHAHRGLLFATASVLSGCLGLAFGVRLFRAKRPDGTMPGVGAA